MVAWRDEIDGPRAEAKRLLVEIDKAVQKQIDHEVPEQWLSDKALRMLDDFRTRLKLNPRAVLTDAQMAAVRSIYERLTGNPTYENAWSAGKVPEGKPVQTPAVLLNLPLKPPRRRET